MGLGSIREPPVVPAQKEIKRRCFYWELISRVRQWEVKPWRASLAGYGTMEGTELPKTSKRQRGRDAYFSFSNTFQPPISAPTVGTQLAQEPRTCSQQQTAWLHTAARGQRGRVDLRAESSRPTCGCIPLTRKNTKKPDHGHLPKSCSQPGFIINEAKILLYSSFIWLILSFNWRGIWGRRERVWLIISLHPQPKQLMVKL